MPVITLAQQTALSWLHVDEPDVDVKEYRKLPAETLLSLVNPGGSRVWEGTVRMYDALARVGPRMVTTKNSKFSELRSRFASIMDKVNDSVYADEKSNMLYPLFASYLDYVSSNHKWTITSIPSNDFWTVAWVAANPAVMYLKHLPYHNHRQGLQAFYELSMLLKVDMRCLYDLKRNTDNLIKEQKWK